ncbi:MAG: hypothetical protein ACSHYA_15115, partial [Opitutaceae bacterium]
RPLARPQLLLILSALECPTGENREVLIAMKFIGKQKGIMDDYTELTGTIIGAAMEVHDYWGRDSSKVFMRKAYNMSSIYETLR